MNHIIVHGKVQGVFFRDFTKKTADSLDIKGTVKNLDDGTVEIFASGKRLEEFIEKLKQGPGEVTNLDIKEIEKKEYKNFEIIF